MKSLPADTGKALAAVAAGWTRPPTAAHPDCRCVVPDPDGAGRHHGHITPDSKAACPIHGRPPIDDPDGGRRGD